MNTKTAVTRPAPPPLEHRLPPCSICGETVEYDEYFYCVPCGAKWNSKHSHLDGYSSWDDPAAPQCPAESRPWLGSTSWPTLAKAVERCLLTAGHESERHNSGEHDWTDADTDGYLAEVGAL